MTPQKLLDNFSTHLKNTIARAISLAHSVNAPNVEPLHLFIALSEEPGSVAAEILKKAKLPIDQIKDRIASYESSTTEESRPLLPDLSATTSSVIEKALLTAFDRGYSYIGTEHLLYALLQSDDHAVQKLLVNANVDPGRLFELAEQRLAASGPSTTDLTDTISELTASLPDQSPSNPQKIGLTQKPVKKNNQPSAVEFFTVNLTDPHIEKKLDPVIGRAVEINRVMNILSRRTKNNPILIGEPGVGKTAIVEGLAKKIRQSDVPHSLKRKKILSLDLTLMIAGTIYRGEFEARLKQVIDELSESPHSILFIDELHTIIGAGSNQGTLDAANILKPALARGELRCIGATTFDEYKKYIAADPALERRFQPIYVSEPTLEQTKEIVRGIKKYYEEFHNLTIADEAIDTAVTLSTKYIHDSFQPDKTIDLIDEAAAGVKIHQEPSSIDVKTAALLREIEALEMQKNTAIAEEQLTAAADYKKKLTKAKQALQKLETRQKKKSTKPRIAVNTSDIIKTLSDRLSIPETLLQANEWDQLDQAEKKIQETIVGQDQVIGQIMGTLRERYLGLGRKNKPRASFLFVGPSGVGKTEMAKALAESLYHDPKALIKLDMSEFAEPHSVAKILGSPAGYIGYKDRNRLFDDLRRHPYSIVLFDEIDKAHADVRKLLLQILDEGELSDSGGKKVYFNHAIIILTANIGAHLFRSGGIGFGESSPTVTTLNDHLTKKIMSAVKEELSPAIVSRLDKICLFPPLTNEHVQKIIAQEITRLSRELHTTQKLTVKPDNEALLALAKEAYQPELGARPVHHIIERVIPELIIKLLRTKKIKHKQHYTLTREQEHYILK